MNFYKCARLRHPALIVTLGVVICFSLGTALVACTDLIGANAESDGSVTRAGAFLIVDDMPELIGGLDSVQEELNYPSVARATGIEGRVFVRFVVNQEGEVRDPTIVRGIGGGCDEEATHAISKSRFKPGMQNNQPVAVKMTLALECRPPGTTIKGPHKHKKMEVVDLKIQDARLSGQIVSAATKTPLKVNVVADTPDGPSGTYTDADGRFELRLPEMTDRVILWASSSDFRTLREEIN